MQYRIMKGYNRFLTSIYWVLDESDTRVVFGTDHELHFKTDTEAVEHFTWLLKIRAEAEKSPRCIGTVEL